ncbi:MAG: ABC transporter permease [Muribaculaceae bacterium]|nr:ABC transporter permease [Muribaculaceae bacterium]
MLKFFTSDLRRNIIKILCLTTGLSIGLLLVARIYFDQTYDSFFENSDRTYLLYESYEYDGNYGRVPTVSGGYAPALKRDFPQVEKSTRFRILSYDFIMVLEDDRRLTAETACCADSNLFDIFNVGVTGGNPKDILVTAGECVIPRSLAEKIGGDAVGTRFTIPELNDNSLFTIAGVYDDFPLNSTIPRAIYFSMESFPDYTSGRDGFMGNDIYHNYVRVAPGTTVDDINDVLNSIMVKNVEENIREQIHLGVNAGKLTSHHSTEDSIRIMDRMLLLLATILLFGAGLNFLIITIGQTSKRSREMAVRKCYGTSDFRIFARVMGESIFYLALSVVLAVLVVFSFPDLCNRLLGYTPAQLFTTGNVWCVITAVCLTLLLLTGAVPAWIYCRTPVATAFRGNIKSRRGWKLALLSVQMFASGVLICLLVLVARQYMKISEVDYGFDYENTVMINLSGIKQSKRAEVVSGLKNIGCVQDLTSAYNIVGDGCSGNMVWLNTDPSKFVIVADNYWVNGNFFELMGMEFIQGDTFTADTDSTTQQVIVEKSFIDVLEKLSGERSDNIVGKTFSISEHDGEYTICGVVNDLHRGDIYSSDDRAGVWFPTRKTASVLYLKLTEINPDNMAAIRECVDSFIPDSNINVITVKSGIEAGLAPVRDFATSVFIAVLAILIITLIGLIGYTGDEIQRRAKEIAIRKVTGTSAMGITGLFVRDILYVAIPALGVGMAVAVIAGRHWLSQFSEQVTLSPLSMGAGIIALLIIIVTVTVINTLGVASSNPVEHLRNE